MHRLVSLMIILSALCVSTVGAVDQGTEPAIDTTVSVSAKGESLAEVVQTLQQKTGIRLRVSREIADCKATVFVTNLPLKDVMSGITKVFGFRWSRKDYKDQVIYELWQPESVRQERESPEAVESAWAAVDKVAASQSTGQERPLYGGRMSAPLCRLYRSLQPDALEALRSGCRLGFSNTTGESRWVLPKDIASEIIAALPVGDSGQEGRPEGLSVSLVAFVENDISVFAWVSSDSPDRTGVAWPMNVAFLVVPVLAGTGNVVPTENSQSHLTMRPMSVGSADLQEVCGPQYALASGLTEAVIAANAEYVNRSDLLELVHKRTGASIFADHYSVYVPSNLVKLSNVSVGVLLEMCSASPGQAVRYWAEGNSLYVRARNPVPADRAEIPNSVCRHWASSYQQNGGLNLDDMIAVCALTDEQRRLISNPAFMMRLGMTAGSAFYTDSECSRAAARFYAGLAPQARQMVETSGLRIGDLSWRQRADLAYIVRHDAAVTTGVGIYMLNGERIDRLDDSELALARLRISRCLPEGIRGIGLTLTVISADGSEKVVPCVLSR